jgi:hypothetical protein
MAIVNAAFAVSGAGELESVAVTVNDEVPDAVGVPVIAPVPAARASPLGSDPLLTDQVIGVVPPVDANVAPE